MYLHITHMADSKTPHYLTCGVILTVEHIICYCQNYSNVRASFDIDNNLHEARRPDPNKITNIF